MRYMATCIADQIGLALSIVVPIAHDWVLRDLVFNIHRHREGTAGSHRNGERQIIDQPFNVLFTGMRLFETKAVLARQLYSKSCKPEIVFGRGTGPNSTWMLGMAGTISLRRRPHVLRDFQLLLCLRELRYGFMLK